jgi:hypothetical protein
MNGRDLDREALIHQDARRDRTALGGVKAGAGQAEDAAKQGDRGETTNRGKNAALAWLLNTAWRPLAIVRVERIEIGDRGWRVVFRE